VFFLLRYSEIRKGEDARRPAIFVGDHKRDTSAAWIVTPFCLAERMDKIIAWDGEVEFYRPAKMTLLLGICFYC
jgi:hypothetical protein